MRIAVAALGLVIALIGASCGDDDDTVGGASPTETTAATALPEGIEQLSPDDPAVMAIRTEFEARLRDTEPNSSVTDVLVAYRGSERVFAANCPNTYSSVPTIVVVYLRGKFVDPSGRSRNTALVSQTESNVSGTLYVDDPPLDPFVWCRPPTVVGY